MKNASDAIEEALLETDRLLAEHEKIEPGFTRRFWADFKDRCATTCTEGDK